MAATSGKDATVLALTPLCVAKAEWRASMALALGGGPPFEPSSAKLMSRTALTGVAWLLSALAALGQVSAPLNITSEEEANIYSTLSQGSLRSHDSVGLALSVGAKVPAAVELHKVPEAVPAPVHGYQYMVHSDRVYIVDPSTREVVRVIPNR